MLIGRRSLDVERNTFDGQISQRGFRDQHLAGLPALEASLSRIVDLAAPDIASGILRDHLARAGSLDNDPGNGDRRESTPETLWPGAGVLRIE